MENFIKDDSSNDHVSDVPSSKSDNDSLEESSIDENTIIKTNDYSLSTLFHLLTTLRPEYITPTCRENLNTIQTLLNNVLKRSIGKSERIRITKFTQIQNCVFFQVLRKGQTQLARCDWPTLSFKHEVPLFFPRKGQSPLVMPPSCLPLPGLMFESIINESNFKSVEERPGSPTDSGKSTDTMKKSQIDNNVAS